MIARCFKCLFLISSCFFLNKASGNSGIPNYSKKIYQDSTPVVEDMTGKKDIVISYRIHVNTTKANGIADSYNGGMKTIFASGDRCRIRLVTLMRIQSLFYFNNKKGGKKTIAIVKESGKDKYKKILNDSVWNAMKNKHDSLELRLYDTDSLLILGYTCKKAEIVLKDGKIVTAYYTPLIRNNTIKLADPFFSQIPGLVLKYEYETSSGKISFELSKIVAQKINPSVFQIPSKGYKLIKLGDNQGGKSNLQLEEDVPETDEGPEDDN